MKLTSLLIISLCLLSYGWLTVQGSRRLMDGLTENLQAPYLAAEAYAESLNCPSPACQAAGDQAIPTQGLFSSRRQMP